MLDMIHSENFAHPAIPIPARVDKVYTGDFIAIQFPYNLPELLVGNKKISFNLKRLILDVMDNFVIYAKNNYSKISLRDFPDRKLKRWYQNTIYKQANVKTFMDDIHYILKEALEAYKAFKEGANLIEIALVYNNNLLAHCEKRLDENVVEVVINGELKEYPLYKKDKWGYINPNIAEIEVIDYRRKKIKDSIQSKNNAQFRKTVKKRGFIPLLIYDDLMECLLYNKKLLEEHTGDTLEKILISPEQWYDDGLIIPIDSNKTITSNFNPENADLEPFNAEHPALYKILEENSIDSII